MLEYGFGREPKSAETADSYTAAIVNDGGTDYFGMTFRRQKNALDLTYLVEVSPDLLTWTAATTLVGAPVDNGDGTENVTIRNSVPVSGQSRSFVRVGVVIGP